MSEIIVHRCELRIRRTSGWAWGASPDQLIAAATRVIPQLLAARLPAIASERAHGEPIHVDHPIIVRVSASARQLAALGDRDNVVPDVVQLRAQIEAEVAAAVVRAVDSRADRRPPAASLAEADVVASERPEITSTEPRTADAPLRALQVWSRTGTLAAVLGRLEPQAVAMLHDWLLGADASAAMDVPAKVARRAEHIAARLAEADGRTAHDTLRLRIEIAAAILEELPGTSRGHLRAAIDCVAPHRADALAVTTVARDEPILAQSSIREIEIRSALPFLLLSSLHHAGWLDSAAALLALHRREPDAFALAAGIAAKVLDPVERGWARSPADRLAIAVFAGRTESIGDAELVAAAARLQPLFAPLDAAIRGVLARARRNAPLVLWRDDRGWLLLDTEGTVVLAAAAELADVLAAAFDAAIFVPARCGDPATLERVDYANRVFITEAPPARGETWRAFAGTTRRLYTNDTSTSAARLAASTACFDDALALADELAGVLAERPSIARHPLAAFEATCELAATAALADLGARLFPAEPTTPVLALTRFRDLDARVWFDSEHIRVRVPLGRRHADLMKHAVLGTFANVPWLPGGTLDLGGG